MASCADSQSNASCCRTACGRRRSVCEDGRHHVRSAAVSRGRATGADASTSLIDAGTAVVMPGLVDTHVHINDPGRADWEGFETATRAAAAGGVTTLVDMPLNSIPPTTTVAALEAKRRAAAGRCHVDVGFWGGVVPGQRSRPRAARARRRARLQVLSESIGRRRVRARQRSGPARGDADRWRGLGLPLLVHAEWPALLREPRSARRSAPLRDLA